MNQHTLTAAIQAWQLCPDASHWPKTIDTMKVATWQGTAIAWPLFDGECFSIFRIADSTVVDEDALPGDVAHALAWDTVQLQPPVAWVDGAPRQ